MSRILELPGESDSVTAETSAHGGAVVDLLVDGKRAAELKAESASFPSWDLTDRQLCDLELLTNGGFSPLRSFMDSATYGSVCSEMKLPDGSIWPMPIVLDVTEEAAAKLTRGDQLASATRKA